VLIVRSPSGVTSTKHRAVAGPSAAAGTVKSTPVALRSWLNRPPSSSFRTLPTKPVLAPRSAAPTAVLAPEPPDTIVAGPIAWNSASARGSSMSCIAPLVTPCAARKASSVRAITSTIALPSTRRSRGAVIRAS
jgi:hypothetical protein